MDPHLPYEFIFLTIGPHLICRLMSFKGWAPLKWSIGNLMFVKGGPPSMYNKCFKFQYKNYWLIYHFTIDFVAIVFVLHCSCDLHEYYMYWYFFHHTVPCAWTIKANFFFLLTPEDSTVKLLLCLPALWTFFKCLDELDKWQIVTIFLCATAARHMVAMCKRYGFFCNDLQRNVLRIWLAKGGCRDTPKLVLIQLWVLKA